MHIPNPQPPRQITLRHHKVNELLGIQLPPEEIEYLLAQLGLKPLSRKPRPVDASPISEPVTFEIPTFRIDLKRETDLIEEVARLHGVDKIPQPPRAAPSGPTPLIPSTTSSPWCGASWLGWDYARPRARR
jgi:phenylalanyl-tRNA synthetase beta chain